MPFCRLKNISQFHVVIFVNFAGPYDMTLIKTKGDSVRVQLQAIFRSGMCSTFAL